MPAFAISLLAPMGFYKNYKQRVLWERCKTSRGARSLLREKQERPLYDAYAFASIDGLVQWLYTPEVLMGLSDLFPATQGPGMPAVGTADDVEFASQYPVVWSLVSSHLDDAGKPREVSTVLFFLDGGAWKVRLSERNHKLDLWGGGSTFSEALASLEGMLLKRPVPWRKQVLPTGKRS